PGRRTTGRRATPAPGRTPSEVAVLDVRPGPQDRLQEDGLRPGGVHRVHLRRAVALGGEERLHRERAREREGEEVAHRDMRRGLDPVGPVLAAAMVTAADLVLPGEPGLVVLGRAGVEDPLAEALAHRLEI